MFQTASWCWFLPKTGKRATFFVLVKISWAQYMCEQSEIKLVIMGVRRSRAMPRPALEGLAKACEPASSCLAFELRQPLDLFPTAASILAALSGLGLVAGLLVFKMCRPDVQDSILVSGHESWLGFVPKAPDNDA